MEPPKITTPTISVIIPTYNRRELVSEAIRSVLAQTYNNYEVIVVDDGSTDGTEEYLKQQFGDRIRYYWQENQGESVARNFGVSQAKGEYLAFLDSDDIWLKDKLEIQFGAITQNPSVAFVYSSAWLIDKPGNKIHSKPVGKNKLALGNSLENLLFRSVVFGVSSNILIRRDKLLKIGGFDITIHYGEDLDFLLRARNHGVFYYVDLPLWCCRIHNNNQAALPSKEKILDVLTDHIKIMDKVFISDESLHNSEFKKTAYAKQFERAGFSFFARREWELGGVYIHKAVEFDPNYFTEARIKTMMSTYCFDSVKDSGLTFEEIDRTVKLFLDHWPIELPGKNHLFKEIVANCYIRAGDHHFRNRNFKLFRQSLIKVLLVDFKQLISKRIFLQVLLSLNFSRPKT